MRKRDLKWKKRKLVGMILFAALCTSISGCGKKAAEEAQEGSICRDFDHVGYTKEGMVYQDYAGDLVKYLDYGTGQFYPLCVRPNCRHDSDECRAYALCGNMRFMGRMGDKWYYYQWGETEETFHVCDLDGGNDRVIGSYPYEEGKYGSDPWGNVLFQDGSCFMALSVDNIEQDPNDPTIGYGVSMTGNVYRYDLETGEREALCPEKTTRLNPYMVYGIYDDKLVYSELLREDPMEKVFRMMDLKTKETTELATSCSWNGDYMNENFLVYNEADEEGTRLVELDLETGEKTVVFEDAYVFDMVWGSELKAFLVSDSSEEGNHRVYRYTDDGECVVLYEKEIFVPYALGGDWVIGQDTDWDRAIIKKEDFLAGKTNWIKIVEEREEESAGF